MPSRTNTDKIKLMEVCGTHTMAIARFGVKRLLPKPIELISGPGCPVCVTAQGEIDKAIAIAGMRDVIMATFGDMMRVPGTNESLADKKRHGADIRVVYSCLDALDIAAQNPGKRVVFMGVGFETTSPTIAATVKEAKRRKLRNFFVLAHFKLLFPALAALAQSRKVDIDGFICPGHVSVITGINPYREFVRKYKKPCVITGFDESDIIEGITRLVEQIKQKRSTAEIEYTRAVKKQGNATARKTLFSVFEPRDSQWRGLGVIKKSGLKLKRAYRQFDADRQFKVVLPKVKNNRGCVCGEVLQGIKSPQECRLFKKACTPQHPIGPCMVSSEGACAAYYKYGA